MDQRDEIMQMKVEAQIREHLRALYALLDFSDAPEAEDQRGFVAEWLAFWDGEAS